MMTFLYKTDINLLLGNIFNYLTKIKFDKMVAPNSYDSSRNLWRKC